MENYIPMMQQSNNLQETVQDGLSHIQKLLKLGKPESTVSLFTDIVQAFSTIEKTLRVIPNEVITEEIKNMTGKIRESLDLVVSFYEAENYAKVQEVLQFNVIPRFTKWKGLLDEAFRPFLVM